MFRLERVGRVKQVVIRNRLGPRPVPPPRYWKLPEYCAGSASRVVTRRLCPVLPVSYRVKEMRDRVAFDPAAVRRPGNFPATAALSDLPAANYR